MATLSPTRRRSTPASVVLASARMGRRPAATCSSAEQRLTAARVREVHARRNLALAIARAERTYLLAVRNLEEFDEYLSTIRAQLEKAGYLSATAGRASEIGDDAGDVERRDDSDRPA
jgi:hypothetical protein